MLPYKYRDVVLKHLHGGICAGLFGVKRTKDQLTCRYYWYKLREDVERYLRTCDTCQRRKRPAVTPQAPLNTCDIGEPFERIAMDLCGPLPETARGNRYVLVIADYFSKYTIPIAVNNKL